MSERTLVIGGPPFPPIPVRQDGADQIPDLDDVIAGGVTWLPIIRSLPNRHACAAVLQSQSVLPTG